jgi:tripartite-type tricarboxylate transporter receptor subunit TctC
MRTILSLSLSIALLFLGTIPASAQFYKGRTLTLLVNYGAGGNADTEARIYQHYLPKYIPGSPSVIVENAPGAGGLNAINLLGLGIGFRPDGLTLGYFTLGPMAALTDDPTLKVKMSDFIMIGAARGWALAYARKDIAPGLRRPTDLVRAKKVFLGGYARDSLHDTRLRLAMELLHVPYTMVTGFQSVNDLNKAMLQNEVSLSASSLTAYQTQVVPEVIKADVGMPLFQFPIVKDGHPAGNPALDAEGVVTFDRFYAEAFGRPPSGPKWDALLMINDLGLQMQRGLMLPKGSPPEAVSALRDAFARVGADPGFIRDYTRATGDRPDLASAQELAPLSERLRRVDPQIKQTLKNSIAE